MKPQGARSLAPDAPDALHDEFGMGQSVMGDRDGPREGTRRRTCPLPGPKDVFPLLIVGDDPNEQEIKKTLAVRSDVRLTETHEDDRQAGLSGAANLGAASLVFTAGVVQQATPAP